MKKYYECHITMATSPTAKEAVEKVGWKFSEISGDPNLGPGVKCYATMQFNEKLTEALIVGKLATAAYALMGLGQRVLRKKIEHVIYDERL